jgi:hypothetical protein
VHPTVAANEADHGRGLWLSRVAGQDTPVLHNLRVAGKPSDRAGAWLRTAMVALGLLAATAAVVSYEAQYRLIFAARHVKLIAALQAGIPDIAALVFAALGIALALNGKRAIRTRVLNVAAVATSIYMNAIASTGGLKALSIWILAPVAYALTSDTLIGVVRSYTVTRLKDTAEDEATPMAMVGRAVLYGLRFMISPRTTARGLKVALLNATPLPEAPKPVVENAIMIRQLGPIEPVKARPAIERPKAAKRAPAKKSTAKRTGGASKKARLIQLAMEHGLADLPITDTAQLATNLAAEVDLHPATARRVLLAHARELAEGSA